MKNKKIKIKKYKNYIKKYKNYQVYGRVINVNLNKTYTVKGKGIPYDQVEIEEMRTKQLMSFNIYNDCLEKMTIEKNEDIKVTFIIKCKKYDNTGKIFTNLIATEISKNIIVSKFNQV